MGSVPRLMAPHEIVEALEAIIIRELAGVHERLGHIERTTMATADEVAAIEQASNDIAAAVTAVQDRVTAILAENGAKPDPALDAAISQLQASAAALGNVGVTATPTAAGGVDPGPPSVPVVDEQGTALASGTGDPVAINGELPGANQTSDQTVPATGAPSDSGTVSDPQSPSAVTTAPARPLYLVDGDTNTDPAEWVAADVKASDGRPLFTFNGDTGTTASGDGLGGVWHVYTGDTIPA